jgi:hypothetical protein
MATSGISRPPRPSRPPRLPPERAPLRDPATQKPVQRRDRRAYERVLAWSLAISVAVHLLFLIISPFFLRVGDPPGVIGDDRDRFARQEIRAVVPVISDRAEQVESEEAPLLDRLPLAPSATEPPRRAVVPAPGSARPARQPGDPAPAAGAAESRREGLRIGPRDSRLWVNPKEVPVPEQSDRERYQAHIQARVDALNDSIRGDAERARRATDWTVTDKEGRRWGLSPDGLHLGGVTVPPALVPRPAPTGDNQSIERQREEQRQRDEIRRQEEARERRRGGGGDD